MDLNLFGRLVSNCHAVQVFLMVVLLLSEEVPEVGDSVVGVADEEVLSLLTVVLLAVDVGEDGRYLTVYCG